MAAMAVLVPYREMCPLAEEMFHAYPSLSRVCVEYIRNDQVENRVRELESLGCDILMARGLHAIRMKHAVKLPVVEIRVTAQELGEMVLDLREELGQEHPKIGLIGFENMLCDTSRFSRLYGLVLHRYLVSDSVDTENALRSAVQQALREGCQAVLGGAVVCETAEMMGLPHRFIPGSRESLRSAFELAKHIGYAIDLEKSARAEIETMLDFALNGIIRVNQTGTVLRVNASALRYADRGEAVGRNITEAFPSLKRDILDKVLIEGEESYAILMPPGGREIVVNTVPIRVDGRADGALVTFHEGKRVLKMNTELNHELYRHGYLANWKFDSIPVKNKENRLLMQKIRQISKYSAPVLLMGEAGCGKQITAECIHNESFAGAFFSLDCRAYRNETLDAMLFGNSDKSPCLVEAARNGTIYLSHVECLSPEMQYKLLRLIHGNFMRSGSSLTQETDVRIIGSTGANLIAKVEKGSFRSDLYYAMNALGFTLIPLRKCREDILPWVELYLNRWRKQYGRPIRLTQDAKDYLEQYDWPGNLDQVNSVCQQMVLLAERRSVDEGFLRRQIERLTPKLLPGTEQVVLYRDKKAVEIAELLKKYNGNRQKVADELGISKTTLWRHMKKYGIGKDFKY